MSQRSAEIIDPRVPETEAFIDEQLALQSRVAEAQAVKTEHAHRQIERINLHGAEVVASTHQRLRALIAKHAGDPELQRHLEEFGMSVIEITKRQIHAASLLASRRIYDEIDRPLSPHAIGNLESVVDKFLRDKSR